MRVKRSVEDWVDVQADSPLHAETLAVNMPGVLSVFRGSAIRGDRPIDQPTPAGIDFEDEDD